MSFRKIIPAETPRIDNVAVQYQGFELYRLQVFQQLFGLTGMGGKVDIGNNGSFYFSNFHRKKQYKGAEMELTVDYMNITFQIKFPDGLPWLILNDQSFSNIFIFA
jgi:hypothetical protein